MCSNVQNTVLTIFDRNCRFATVTISIQIFKLQLEAVVIQSLLARHGDTRSLTGKPLISDI